MTERVRYAIVGLGHISKSHLQAIAACKDEIELVGVCDSVAAKAATVAEAHGSKAFTDLDDMLKVTSPELLALCTPSGLHAAQGQKAARNHCHILTEKPLAVSIEDAKSLIKTCKDNKVQLMVMLQQRLLPAMQLLKNYLDEGRLGKVYLVQSNLFWTRPEQYFSEAGWRGTHTHDGGLFINQAIHHIDLMQWLLGDVESVQASAARLVRDIETEDTGTALLQWPSGTLGSLNVTLLTYPKNMETSLTLLCEKGTLRFSFSNPAGFTQWNVEGTPKPETDTNLHLPTLYYRHAVRVLRHSEPPLVSGEQGLKSLALAHAIKRAASGPTPHLTQEARA